MQNPCNSSHSSNGLVQSGLHPVSPQPTNTFTTHADRPSTTILLDQRVPLALRRTKTKSVNFSTLKARAAGSNNSWLALLAFKYTCTCIWPLLLLAGCVNFAN